MTTNNDPNKKIGILQKIRSVRHIELIIVAALCVILIVAYFAYEEFSGGTNAETSDGGEDTAEKVAAIISEIEGVGKCEVLITYDGSDSYVIAYDEETVTTVTTDSDDNSSRVVENSTTMSSPVIITSDGRQQPLIISTKPAAIEGIVVVAEGGDDVYVRIRIIDALCALLDVDGGKIKVYKMK